MLTLAKLRCLRWNWPNRCFHFLRTNCLTFVRVLWPRTQMQDSRVQKFKVVNLHRFAKLYASEVARKRTILFIKNTMVDIAKQQKVLRCKQKEYLLFERSLFESATRGEIDYATMRIQLKWLNKVYENVMEKNIAFVEKYKKVKGRAVKEVAEWVANPPFDFDKLNGMTEEELETSSDMYYKKSEKWAAEFNTIFQDIKVESDQLLSILIADLRRCIEKLQWIRISIDLNDLDLVDIFF
ncbi:hypothetical protein Ocin01_07656 [Orchesella cincta]|uniref:Uncharacterized protein n=1 Tax=Orchesella cincta TaxID=48709 RepID=A0A1D2N154_ORCCI|nr:hypothetical protein Ocin01_07656 [Orchesella cincta]